MNKTFNGINDAFKNIDYIDGYIDLGQAVCALGVEDMITYIKPFESNINEARQQLAKVKELQSRYNELLNHPTRNKSELTTIVKKLFRIKRRGLHISSNINKSRSELIGLHEFFSSDWFIQINGMELDYSRVVRNVMKRNFNLDFDNIIDYLEYYTREIKTIAMYIQNESVKGLNTSLLNK